jgi:hypothetical protein
MELKAAGAVIALVLFAGTAGAQQPAAPAAAGGANGGLDTARIEKLTGLAGKSDEAEPGVFKVSAPRTDLSVTAAGVRLTPPMGLTSWAAFKKAGAHVTVMGDMVLLEDQVNPVMSAALDAGLEVTALHNHFFHEQPRIFYLHVHGAGGAADLARRVRPALGLIGRPASPGTQPRSAPPGRGVTGSAVAKIIGHEGEQNGPVYKITIGRPDIDMRAHGARINSRMGLNTWAAFAGSDDDAMVAGDVAMLEHELTPVLKALRKHGLEVVAIHHHMTGVQPLVVFLHYFGRGDASALARGVRAAVDELGKARGGAQVRGREHRSGKRPSLTERLPSEAF